MLRTLKRNDNATPGAQPWAQLVGKSDTTAHLSSNGSDFLVLSQALAQTDDMVLITDAKGSVTYVNASFERATGYARHEIIGGCPSILKSGQHTPEFYANLWRTLKAGKAFRAVFTNRRRNGDLYQEQKTITPLRDDDGNITHYVSTAKDITERVSEQRWMEHLASHDQLTDLPNRRLFSDRLTQGLLRAARDGSTLAVLFLDLDRFKNINDSLGHTTGDELLRAVADRLKQCGRGEDTVANSGRSKQ